MNDVELHEIVKDHRDAWPKNVGCDQFKDPVSARLLLLFEASFHRAILKHTYCIRVEDHIDIKYVIVKHRQFEAPTLIEAYAKALEWLK